MVRRVRSEDCSIFVGYWFCENGDIVERETGTVLPVYSNGTVRVMNDDGFKQYVPAHRLIAEAFVEHSEEENYVHFKDGDKTNRRASNLVWSRSAKPLGSRSKEIIKLWENSWRITDIAFEMQVTPQYVHRVIRDHKARSQ